MKAIKNILPLKYKKTLYEALIKPHLEYGIIFWGGVYESHINPLIIQQKKCIRHITNSKYNEHTSPIFKTLKCLKLIDVYKLNITKFMYKAKMKMLPPLLHDIYTPNTLIHTHNTRQRQNPHLIPNKNNQIAKQVTHKGPDIWIKCVPPHLKDSKTLKYFSKKMKEFLI